VLEDRNSGEEKELRYARGRGVGVCMRGIRPIVYYRPQVVPGNFLACFIAQIQFSNYSILLACVRMQLCIKGKKFIRINLQFIKKYKTKSNYPNGIKQDDAYSHQISNTRSLLYPVQTKSEELVC
jgi:hypothetical protein